MMLTSMIARLSDKFVMLSSMSVRGVKRQTGLCTDGCLPLSAEAAKPAESPASGLSGFFENLREMLQPEAAKQPSTEGLPSTEGAKGEASPPPALTAGIEADTDKKSDTPAVQSLLEGQSVHIMHEFYP